MFEAYIEFCSEFLTESFFFFSPSPKGKNTVKVSELLTTLSLLQFIQCLSSPPSSTHIFTMPVCYVPLKHFSNLYSLLEMKTWCLDLLRGRLKGYICSGWSPFLLASVGHVLTRGSWELVNPTGDSTYLKRSLSVFLGHIHPEEHFFAWGHQRPGVLNLTLVNLEAAPFLSQMYQMK